MLGGSETPLEARMPSSPRTIHGVTHTLPSFAVPAGATDCHVHVFGPGNTYPWAESRVYTPGDASIESLQAHQGALGLSRVVIVHPSPYGTDNRCSIDAIAKLGGKARGVAVIDPATISDAALEALHKGGMRGARANLATAGVSDPAAAWRTFEALSRRIKPLGWHLQTFTTMPVIAALADRLASLPVPLVVDHFGGARAELGPGQPGFGTLLRLVADGRAYVKLSGAYRVSKAAGFADVAPLARALIAANRERMLWGSDWPHPGGVAHSPERLHEIEPFHAIDDGAALDRLHGWAGADQGLVRSILVDNPARLYGW